jgi:hypothetical protein
MCVHHTNPLGAALRIRIRPRGARTSAVPRAALSTLAAANVPRRAAHRAHDHALHLFDADAAQRERWRPFGAKTVRSRPVHEG